jgi:hypothetical protein
VIVLVAQSGDVSALTLAWIAALASLLGVAVGAVLGGAVELWVASRQEAKQAKVGARLVRVDLSLAADHLREAAASGQWWQFFDTSMEAWDVYRAPLAAQLDGDAFEHVTQSVYELARFGSEMRRTPSLMGGEAFVNLGSAAVESLAKARRNATTAYNDLAGLAGGERVALLHGD